MEATTFYYKESPIANPVFALPGVLALNHKEIWKITSVIIIPQSKPTTEVVSYAFRSDELTTTK